MKKLVLLSALILANVFAFAQAPKAISKEIKTQERWGEPGHGGYHAPPVMSQVDFRMACDVIARQAFDRDKLSIAKQVVRDNLVSSLQVRDMASLLTFESTRVDFLKAAYTSVVDPQNYYVTNDVLTFSSSIAQVTAYTNSVGMSGGGTWTGSYGGMNSGGQNGCGGGGSGSGHGHGHGHGYGHGGGHHNHAGPCSSACGTMGQNGYYGNGGGNCGAPVSGSGHGITFSGGMNVQPAAPMCGMCSGYHQMNILCEGEFGNVANAINNRVFESDKILVAKQAIGGRLLSASQVGRVMDMFTFESTKLDFAKWAYRQCFDPQNYYIVNDAFTFSSSIRELDEYIRRG